MSIIAIIAPRIFHDNDDNLHKINEVLVAQWACDANGTMDSITEGITP